MSHPVYPGGPDCQPNCPGDWSEYHDGYADGYERGQTDERERQIAVRKDWGTLPHGEFHQKYGRLDRDLYLLPSNCSCRECQMWSS